MQHLQPFCLLLIVMAFSIQYWMNYTAGKVKLVRRSENVVESNHVLKFRFDTDNFHVSSVVQASMRDKSYKVEVDLDEYFGIFNSSCECPLGNFKCHHVAASLLFGYKRASKTDVKCSWLKNPKSHLKSGTSAMEYLHPPRQPNYRALDREISKDDLTFLHEKLGGLGRFTALHWILSPEPGRENLELQVIPVVEDLIMSEAYVSAVNPLTWLRRELLLSPTRIALVVQKTVGQRNNPLWSVVRKNRITASNFGVVLAAIKRNRYPPSLFKRLLAYYNLDRVKSVAWGITHEKTAITSYCRQTGFKVEETGIWMHESGVIGASPDGIVSNSPNQHIIEVKCPYSARDMKVTEAVQSVKGFFLVHDVSGKLTLDRNHEYWHQVQGQLHITGMTACDLVVWTTQSLEVIKIQREEEWQENITKLIDFYFTNFLDSQKPF